MDSKKVWPIKTRRVSVTDKKTGTKYIEERQYRYDPVKKYNIVISSRRVGEKINKGETEVTRCRPKRKAGAAKELVTAKRTRVGATDLLRHAGKISGLEDAVRKAYLNGGTADKLLSVAQYLVASGDTVHNVEAWQCEHDLPYKEGLSEDICYNLFEELGEDESGMQSLFMALAAVGGQQRQPSIAFDSTSHSAYAEGLKPFARQGFNKDGDGLDIYKHIDFFSLTSGLPIAFELQPGNIPDVTSLLNAVQRAKCYGLLNPELVLDNGFFSKENILRFLRNNMKFTILASLDHKWIYSHLDAVGDKDVRLRDSFTRYGSQCPFDPHTSAVSKSLMTPFQWKRERSRNDAKAGQTESKSFRLYYHFYRNNFRANLEATTFHERLRVLQNRIEDGVEMEEKELETARKFFTWKRVRGGKIKVWPNEEAIAEQKKDFGIFVLLTNLHKDPWEALKRYRRRNEIETSYRTVKSELDGRKPRVWTTTNLRGKEICRHIALGYRFVLRKLLDNTVEEARQRAKDCALSQAQQNLYGRVEKWAKELTIGQLLDWFDCVELVEVTNSRARYRWSTETTTRDRAFLELFMDEKRWV